MMCEASENEVDVNQHPSMENGQNIEATNQVSNETVVDHVNKIDNSNVNDKPDSPEVKSCNDAARETVDESTVVTGENNLNMNQDSERNQQYNHQIDQNVTVKSNGINKEATETSCNPKLNGHTNGTYVNGDQSQDVRESHNGSDSCRDAIGVQSPRPSVGHIENTQVPIGRSAGAYAVQETEKIEIKPIPIGDPKVRSKIRFEVVTARVIETGGKKHVAYTIMMKRVGHEPHPAVIERRYSDFCFVYECILRSFHPSILGDFMFPKKVLIGNFKAEVISERTDAFHKFLNLIANCDNLLYSDYFYSFLSSEEHNEAVSHLKLARYTEAIPLLESIFYVREKLLSVGSIHVLLCSCELVACLSADVTSGMIDRHKRRQEAFAFAQVAAKSFDIVYQSTNADEVMVAESLRIPYLKLTLELATELGQDKKAYARQLSELRYAGVKIENSPSLLEVIRDRYIHRASHTSKIS